MEEAEINCGRQLFTMESTKANALTACQEEIGGVGDF